MSKYNSKKITIDWITFDSQVEAQFYQEHKDQIAKVHPKYELIPSFVKDWVKYRATVLIADFELVNWDVIDIKWMATETAKLKRKMFNYKYPDVKLHWLCYGLCESA